MIHEEESHIRCLAIPEANSDADYQLIEFVTTVSAHEATDYLIVIATVRHSRVLSAIPLLTTNTIQSSILVLHFCLARFSRRNVITLTHTLHLHLNRRFLLLFSTHFVHRFLSNHTHIVPRAHITNHSDGNESGERGEVIDPLLVVDIDGRENERRRNERSLPEEVVIRQCLTLYSGMCGGLFITAIPPSLTLMMETEVGAAKQKPIHKKIVAAMEPYSLSTVINR